MCSVSVITVLNNTDHLLKTYEQCCTNFQREGLLELKYSPKISPKRHIIKLTTEFYMNNS